MIRNLKNLRRKDRANRTPRLLFTGFSMGVADLIPGVSGGTIAFLLGIYDELLYTIKLLTGTVPKLLLEGKVKEAFRAIPFGFLLPLVSGLLLAIFGLVGVVSYLLDNQAVYVWSLFFGLVLGSVYVVSKRIPEWSRKRVMLLASGFVVTFLLLGLPVLGADATPLILFSTGAIASLAMILPGISGSLIMVMLGQYANVVGAIASRDVLQLAYFALGAITGLALFARLLSWLLKNHHAGVVAVLIGVMIGSLRSVWPWQVEQQSGLFLNVLPDSVFSVFWGLILIVLGFIIVWRLEKLGLAREHIDIEDKEFIQEVKAQHD